MRRFREWFHKAAREETVDMLRREYEQDEELEELDGADGSDGSDEDEEDDLEDLDPEVRERFERLASKRVKAVEGRITQARQGLQARGLDLADDGTTVIRDPGKATEWLGRPAAPERPEEKPRGKGKETEEEDDGAWADPDMEPERFQKQFDQRVSKKVSEITQGQETRVQQMQALLVSREAERAIERVPEAVERHAEWLADYLEHPDFETVFKGYLTQFPLDAWQDGRNLARIAGMAAVDLDMDKLPRKGRGTRNARAPEANAEDRVRTTLNRRMLEQAGSSRGTGKGPTPRSGANADDLIFQAAAERLGISVEEARALGQDINGDAYMALRAKARRDEARGGRR